MDGRDFVNTIMLFSSDDIVSADDYTDAWKPFRASQIY